MRKIIIIPLLILVLLSASVFADWSATRKITGNDVTLTITPGDGFDTFTIVETVSGVTITDKSWGSSSCGLSGSKLTCDYDGVNQGIISYKTTGTGTVSGKIDGVNSDSFVSASKTITGDTNLAPLACVPSSEVCNGLDDNCDKVVDENLVGCCSGVMKNLQTDPANCGSCNNVCSGGKTCVSGACTLVCPQDQKNCNEVCKNIKTDVNNCGNCGIVCKQSETCQAGVCTAQAPVCAPQTLDKCKTPQECFDKGGKWTNQCVISCGSLTDCSNVCKDTKVDTSNCGGCGKVCLQGQTCQSGVCTAPQQQTCANDNKCKSTSATIGQILYGEGQYTGYSNLQKVAAIAAQIKSYFGW